MTELTQLPGDLPIEMILGNDFSFKVDWGKDMTDYTFAGWIEPVGGTNIPITITPIDITLGTYTFTITKASIATIPVDTDNKWRLDRTTPSPASLTRTVISGTFKVLRK